MDRLVEPVALAIPRVTAIGLGLPVVSGAAMTQDLAMGPLAQCWKATVRRNTKMETGSPNSALTGDQVQSLNKAIAAHDAENDGTRVAPLKDISSWDK